MAIYTTELLTDRDYNIPEGRLPLEYAVDQANKAKTHSENTEVHVTAEEKASWNHTTQHGDIVYDLNKMFPDAGETTNGPTKLWKQFYAINRIRRYFYDIDVANGDTDPETGFTYSKKMMVPGIKIRHYRAALSGYIPDPFWATYSWVGGNIDWNWNPDTDGNTNEFDDFSNTTKWQFSVTEHQFDLHLDGETTDSSGNFTRHITDAEREKWNAAVENVSGLESTLLDQWEEDQTTRIMQLGSDSGLGSPLPIFNNCSSFIYNTNRELMFNAIRILVKADDIPTVRVNGIVGENKSFTPENDYFYMVYRFPVSISTLGDLTFTITGANAVGGGASNISNATLRFDPEKDWGYYPFVELLDMQIIHHKGVKTKVWRMYAMDAQGIASPMSLTDDGFKRVFNSLTKTWESNGWAYTTLDWGTLSLEETTPVLLGFTVEIHSNYEMVENELHEIELYYNDGSTGSTLRRVRLR